MGQGVVQGGELALFPHPQVETALAGQHRPRHHVVQRAKRPATQPRVAHEAVVAQVVVVVGDEDVEHHAREQLLGIGLHRHGMNVAADGAAQVRIGLVGRFELAAGHQGEAADKRQPPFHPPVAGPGVLQSAFRHWLARVGPVAVEPPDEHDRPSAYVEAAQFGHGEAAAAGQLQGAGLGPRHVEGVAIGRKLGQPKRALVVAHGRFGPCTASRWRGTQEVFEVRRHRSAVLHGLRGLQHVLQRVHVAGRWRAGARARLPHVQRAHPVASGVQQVLPLQQAVGRRLQARLDDPPAPGVGGCVADASELTQPVDREEQLALDALPVTKRQAHRVQLERLLALQVARAVGELAGELAVLHVGAVGLRQAQDARGHEPVRVGLRDVAEDVDLGLPARHQKSSRSSSVLLKARTRCVASRAASACSDGSSSFSSDSRLTPGAIASR